VLEDDPDLERDDVLAVLEVAAVTVGRQRVVPARGHERSFIDAQLPWRLTAFLTEGRPRRCPHK
jgi:hypothetical protein